MIKNESKILVSEGHVVTAIGEFKKSGSTSGTLAYSTTNDPFLFQGGYHTAGGNTGAGNVPNRLYH